MTYVRTSAKAALLAGLAMGAALAIAPTAHATENGASVYLLGSGGPDAAVLPPVEGVFFSNTVWYYDASLGGGRELPLGGNIVAGVDSTVVADFATVLWVPSTSFAGGTLALGATLPFGHVSVDADAVLTGPGGTPISVSASDDAWIVGDPVLMGSLSWKKGNTYFAASTLINVPIGDYRDGELANLAFHRWAVDASLAVSWHDPESGWDLSAKGGITFNGENEDTDYDSGDELHFEGSVSRALNPKWTLGAQAYYFDQQTGDSGAGARLGDFKGKVTGVGGFAAYNFAIGHRPATLRLRAFHEFDAENRPEGDSLWLDFSVPLAMHLPPGAGGQ
jgi:hypothetical protein